MVRKRMIQSSVRKLVSRLSAPVLAAVVLLSAEAAHACSVCYGDPESEFTKAMNFGILFLLAVILAVLGAFAYFFIQLRRREQLYSPTTDSKKD